MTTNILSLTKSELEREIINLGDKPYRATQIWQWLYKKGIFDFAKMSNINQKTRDLLNQKFIITLPEVSSRQNSTDGTIKFLVKYPDKSEVEAVYIPETKRATLCISSQVGCTLACKFCHTGTQTWVRNLEFHEITAQILIAKNLINDWNNKKLTNIVFMGMGEPFFNYENVKKCTETLNNKDGLDLPLRKITISTSGLVPEILKSATEIKSGLAISLHAANDELRTEIMAINKKYPLKDLFLACKTYNQENPKQKITFEYVMLAGVNDSQTHAKELIAQIKKHNLNAKINLIPFNSWLDCPYECSDPKTIEAFHQVLKKADLISTIRKTRGADTLAACGQLKSNSKRIKKKTHD